MPNTKLIEQSVYKHIQEILIAHNCYEAAIFFAIPTGKGTYQIASGYMCPPGMRKGIPSPLEQVKAQADIFLQQQQNDQMQLTKQ